MLPQIVGPGTFTPSPLAPSAAERSVQGAQPAVGETAASAIRPEIANRVDPQKVIPAPLPLPDDRRRADSLLPPDPEAPAGPPPAFEATPLERAREVAFAAVNLIAPPPEPDPGPEAEAAAEAPSDAPARTPGPEEAPPASARGADPGDDLRDRVAAEVAEVRRMADPGPGRTIDLTR